MRNRFAETDRSIAEQKLNVKQRQSENDKAIKRAKVLGKRYSKMIYQRFSTQKLVGLS